MKIKSPEELQKISEEGQEIFEQVALESNEFKCILYNLENAAMDGHTEFEYKLTDEDDVRSYYVYEKALKKAGYTAQVKTEQRRTLFNTTFDELYFIVSWKK